MKTVWNVHIGVTGPHVEEVQERLNVWAETARLRPIVVDGHAGNGTHDRILAYQKAHGLEADGTIGPDGWASLDLYRIADLSVPDLLVINESTMPDAELTDWVLGVQAQVDEDFTWGAANLHVGTAADIDGKAWLLPVRDRSTFDGALGWHSISNEHGDWDPVGEVSLEGGLGSVTLSHEVLEMIANPMIGAFQSVGTSEWWILEVCDPVQRQSYTKRGVQVSDFVHREWFGDPGESGGYNHLGTLVSNYQLERGGYQIVYNSDTREFDNRFGATSPTEMLGSVQVADHTIAKQNRLIERWAA